MDFEKGIKTFEKEQKNKRIFPFYHQYHTKINIISDKNP